MRKKLFEVIDREPMPYLRILKLTRKNLPKKLHGPYEIDPLYNALFEPIMINDAVEEIFRMLATNPPMTRYQLYKETRISRNTAYRYLDRLERRRWAISRTETTWRNKRPKKEYILSFKGLAYYIAYITEKEGRCAEEILLGIVQRYREFYRFPVFTHWEELEEMLGKRLYDFLQFACLETKNHMLGYGSLCREAHFLDNKYDEEWVFELVYWFAFLVTFFECQHQRPDEGVILRSRASVSKPEWVGIEDPCERIVAGYEPLTLGFWPVGKLTTLQTRGYYIKDLAQLMEKVIKVKSSYLKERRSELVCIRKLFT